MSGAELKALIPDTATVYGADGNELMAQDVMQDKDGDIFITLGESDDEEDFEDEDEEEDEEE